MKKLDWKQLLPYAVALVLFVGFTLLYCSPMLDGKVLNAGDVNNWKGIANETLEYRAQTGENTHWTNSLFGGMPTFQIAHKSAAGTLSMWPRTVLINWLNEPMAAILLYLTGFFLMLICFGVNPWLSIVGAFALSLSSYFFLILPAGHMTKAFGLGLLAPVLGGVYAIFRKKYWLGAPLLAFYAMCSLTLHPQMTYYFYLLVGVCCVAELYTHIREQRWKDLGVGVGVIAVCLLLAFSTKASWWQMNQEYLAETMRGGHSELTSTAAGENAQPAKGLDIDYATAWSYGKAETLTLLIPNYMGGASGYNLGKDSQLEKDLKKMGVPGSQAKQFCAHAPTYWGEKAFTSGPVYAGAVICFLFVLGLLIVPGPYKWALLFSTLMSVMLAWGRNFMGLTELFYNYFPMYNKFRAVESILVVAEVTIPLLGMLALVKLSEAGKDAKRALWMRTSILIAGGVTGAICLFVALFGGGFDVTSSYDAQWKGQVGPQIYDAILSQRRAMMQSDAWRSLVFVLLGAALTYGYAVMRSKGVKEKGVKEKGEGSKGVKEKGVKTNVIFAGVLLVLILADMVPVDRRFFGSDSFINAKDDKRYFAEQPWETQILQDKSLDYRVYNLAANTFNDSRTSYRLKSVGGYHAAKLRRYQDLIDAHLMKNNWNVLNMLNTKYIITRDGQVHQNPEAMGNAWFVDEVRFVDTPDQESEALWNLDLKHAAVADKRFADVLTARSEGQGALMMTEYKPDQLTYQSVSDQEKVAVFSEIYYPHGWHLYVDEQEVPLGRVNYTLRAATIPAGKHVLRMAFVPDGMQWDKLCAGIAILISVLGVIVICWPLYGGRRKQTATHVVAE